ncbi:LytTR family transcriptional regulator [Lachnospiraceae bacterium]|nr:LytTR family transcriptional regulator [Ruminococcus sp.]NBI57374.1 LytTR family transcriptional regulator [Lachnospiraceae bacterium]
MIIHIFPPARLTPINFRSQQNPGPDSNLSPYGWFRCHKGYLVNLNQIDAIYPMFNSTYNIRVKGQKEEIPVSRTYLKAFRSLLNI